MSDFRTMYFQKLDIKIPDAITNGFHDRSSDTVSDAEVLDG